MLDSLELELLCCGSSDIGAGNKIQFKEEHKVFLTVEPSLKLPNCFKIGNNHK